MLSFGVEPNLNHFSWSCILKLKFIEKNQCSKVLFCHGRSQYEQDFAFHGSMSDNNSNFSKICICGEEFERQI